MEMEQKMERLELAIRILIQNKETKEPQRWMDHGEIAYLTGSNPPYSKEN